MSEYKDALKRAMDQLAADPKVVFIGYGVKHGGQAAGTLKDVPPAQLIETPVAENLMVGVAIGLALAGLRPVVFIERFDFILNAMDAIVNHLDKMGPISGGEFVPAIIFRVVIGNKEKGLKTGMTHTQDFGPALRQMVNFPLVNLDWSGGIEMAYMLAKKSAWGPGVKQSVMLVEQKDSY